MTTTSNGKRSKPDNSELKEKDKGYNESHGYGPGHGGPTGPGDAPSPKDAPGPRNVPTAEDDEKDPV